MTKSRGLRPIPLAVRFWSKVDIRSPKECWPWKGARRADRGTIRLRVDGRWRMAVSSRVAWMLTKGPIPDGLGVLHRCDNAPCCNPRHLFVGTHKDNCRDRWAKGGYAKGEQHPHARLTAAEVRRIRAQWKKNERNKQRRIAARFGVSQGTIWNIAHRKTWAHVA